MHSMREERIRDEKRREGWRRGRCIDGWMYEPHPFSPLRGEERVWGSPSLPTAASPLLKGEWMMVMVMMDLDKQHSSVA